jgi:hypothetical protein
MTNCTKSDVAQAIESLQALLDTMTRILVLLASTALGMWTMFVVFARARHEQNAQLLLEAKARTAVQKQHVDALLSNSFKTASSGTPNASAETAPAAAKDDVPPSA